MILNIVVVVFQSLQTVLCIILKGVVIVLAGAPAPLPVAAPAPGPLPHPLCPSGAAPQQWSCTGLGQPYMWDAAVYDIVSPLAAAELCFGVGGTSVLCGGATMEAVAYQAR